jgi:hypothetical protein
VPRAVGSIVADWPDRRQAAGRAHGHLAVAQEFLTGALDGWAVALDSVRRGADFRDAAFALGVATAGVHGTLAAHLEHRPMEADDIVGTVAQMRARLTAAIAAVPALAPHAPALDAAIVRAEGAQWPDLQRIHGDLHLGQALLVPGRDWVLVDFEGEPMRPMAERTRLDSPLRDIAGMLRSFDYVAGSVAITGALAHAIAWVADACAAFTVGYGEASGQDLDAERDLVRAKMKETYDLFASRVATGRPGMDLATTAEGRLFTGAIAVQNKMADRIGGLQEAIADMATELQLQADQYDVLEYPGAASFAEVIGESFGVSAGGIGVRKPSASAASPSPFIETIRALVGERQWPSVRDSLGALMQLRDEPILLASPRVIIVR